MHSRKKRGRGISKWCPFMKDIGRKTQPFEICRRSKKKENGSDQRGGQLLDALDKISQKKAQTNGKRIVMMVKGISQTE